jgi:hypothetical protein
MEPGSQQKASSILGRHFGEPLLENALYRIMDVLKKLA